MLVIAVIGFIIYGIIKGTPKHILNSLLEDYKNELNKELEELKNKIDYIKLEQIARNDKKRIVYSSLIKSMAVFVEDKVPPSEVQIYKQDFLQSYDECWLWASDEVLKAIGEYMDLKQGIINENNDIEGLEKELYLNCVFTMRKDVGFLDTQLEKNDYKFIKF